MYNEVKINMLDNDCDCEYVLSEDGSAITPFVYIRMYIGEGLENIEVRAQSNNQENYWLLPEISGGYVDGWYLTRLSYSDFAKTGSENYEIGVQAFANGEQIGTKTLFFFHNGLQSSGDWVVTKQHGVIRDAYEVMQGSSSSGGGGGGSGGGGITYTAGNGIEISDSDEIKAKIDSSTIQFNSNGQMYVPTVPLTLENAIVIQEADAKYLLHEYTTVDYIAGNKIVYAGVGESIIVQGYITRKNSGSINVAINGDDPDADGSKFEAACAEYSFHTSISLDNACYSYNSSQPYYITKIETVYEKWDSTYTYYDLILTKADGTTEKLTDIDTRNSAGAPNGLTLVYREIYAPGVVFNGYSSDTGFVVAYLGYKIAPSTNGMIYRRSVTVNTLWKFYIPFASLAEYNAAVGLTYEPNVLKQVNETITEV